MDPALTFGYALYSENDTLIFWSYQTDMAPEKWIKITPGLWSFRSRIPSQILNEGNYKIKLIASIHFKEWILDPVD